MILTHLMNFLQSPLMVEYLLCSLRLTDAVELVDVDVLDVLVVNVLDVVVDEVLLDVMLPVLVVVAVVVVVELVALVVVLLDVVEGRQRQSGCMRVYVATMPFLTAGSPFLFFTPALLNSWQTMDLGLLKTLVCALNVKP